jgi:hypothetical protein
MIKEELLEIIKKEGDEYKFEAFGLPCLMIRNTRKGMGHWCGYVGVPKESELNGKDYYVSSKSELGISKLEQAINDISIHGGFTFSGKMKDDDTWYFGFDCAHLGDIDLYMFDFHEIVEEDTYKDKDFVISECQNLARQLKQIIGNYN